ncbi:unnamed protein product [Enterobius vermicularis]|uniref:Cytochrome c oxidase assembly protein COX20, mitochondrial n=1 Tax=Enterobius vermicularis TaxID=51028 RepID=A0A0N4UV99_ENTVE|nr:unnamed protein product [Enterobius vermicularis]
MSPTPKQVSRVGPVRRKDKTSDNPIASVLPFFDAVREYPRPAQVGIGGAFGLITGYFFTKCSKVAAGTLGIGLLLYQYCNHKNYFRSNGLRLENGVERVRETTEHQLSHLRDFLSDERVSVYSLISSVAGQKVFERQSVFTEWFLCWMPNRIWFCVIDGEIHRCFLLTLYSLLRPSFSYSSCQQKHALADLTDVLYGNSLHVCTSSVFSSAAERSELIKNVGRANVLKMYLMIAGIIEVAESDKMVNNKARDIERQVALLRAKGELPKYGKLVYSS